MSSSVVRKALSMGLVLGAVAAADVNAQVENGTPLEWQPGGRIKAYGESILGVSAIVDVGVASGLDQWRDKPPEWDQDLGGFGKRVASNAGRNAVSETVQHGLAAVMDRSVTYRRCTCSDFGGKLWNAFVETITDRDRDGHRLPAIPRFAGSVAGAYAESAWQPGARNHDVVRIATRSLVWGTVGNIWKEFVGWP